MMQEILRQPNPWPQTKVLTRTEKEILYGWARWWGKTDAWICWFLRWVENPWLRWLVLRESYNDLVDWIDRAMVIYSNFGAVKSWNPCVIKFPSWAEIRTWYLKGQSYEKYKGHEYQKMLIEELTLIPAEEKYEKLMGSLRSTVTWLKPQIFLTTNPDWPWRLRVKKRFVDITRPWLRYQDSEWNTRVFISAKITDNQVLLDKDPDYIKYLRGIKDDQLRKAWLEWDWEAYDVKGSIYGAQIKQARHEWRFSHVPWDDALDVYTAWDVWISDYTTILFFQIYGKELRIIDSYYNDNEWVKHYAQVLRDKPYKYKKHFLPHDANIRSKSTLRTYTDDARSAGIENIQVLARTNNLWENINRTREVFAHVWVDQDKCKTFLEHIEVYRKEYDEHRAIFKDKPYHWVESHFADSFRYVSDAYLLLVRRKYSNAWIIQAKS